MQGRVDLNFNLVEKQTKGISGGGGLTSIGQSEGALPGIVANAAYSQHNLFGLNQKLNASVAIGQVRTSLLEEAPHAETQHTEDTECMAMGFMSQSQMLLLLSYGNEDSQEEGVSPLVGI